MQKKLKKLLKYTPYFLCIAFFIAFSTLSVVRHNHYGSFGYDLGINDQTVWKYSQLKNPITTIDPFPDKPKLATHVELVYPLISPFYLLWNSATFLLILEVAFISSSGMAIYFLARKRKLSESISNVLVISYLGFFGIQNALWFDVHSITFGAAFVAWFLYFFDIKKYTPALIFLILGITSKENIGLITFLISFYYLITAKNKKWPIIFMIISVSYVLFIFKIFYPHIMHVTYLYQNGGGLLSNVNPLDLVNTQEKIKVIFYSLFSYGFLPLLSPLTLIPFLGDLATYFVLGSELPGAQDLFGQYRVMLSPLLAWSTIITISKYKKLNKPAVAILLLVATLIMQYHLHLPLSYLAKPWFWNEPASVKDIDYIIKNYLPADASVASQNNITPHISHRDKIYTLYPEKKSFSDDSICGQSECDWLTWYDNPDFLIVNLASDWDARHFLTDRENFQKAVENLEKAGLIKIYREQGDTKLFKVQQNALANTQ